MTTATGPYGDAAHPYGLPMGTVRGFMSVLICSFFWIYLLLPDHLDQKAMTAPLAHFFLLTLVFLSFATNPLPHPTAKSAMLPWLMRVLFVGGSLAVVGYVAYANPDRLGTRLTPEAGEIGMWPVLLATLSGGFAAGLFMRFLLKRNANNMFQTLRAWVGVLAILLLVAETVFEFLIRPGIAGPLDPNAMKIWEGVIIAFVAAYFGTRA